MNINQNAIIEKIEWALLPGIRTRHAGMNAYVTNPLGDKVPHSMARVTIGSQSGFGQNSFPWLSPLTQESAEQMVGRPVSDIFTEKGSVKEPFLELEFALLDWFGQVAGQPIYKIFGKDAVSNSGQPFSVECYDTSLYFDDLHLDDAKAGVELMQQEASEGMDRGHRHFKIKVGRGARHMGNAAGLERDIAIVHGIRETIGPDAKLMIDANNGYNLNMTKEVLSAVAEAKVYWIEEAFFENPELYAELKQWMKRQDMNVLIADGEGHAAIPLVAWAMQGHIDIIQYDIFEYGFGSWLDLGRKLDASGIKSAPHNYSSGYGNYATAQLAAAIEGFQFVEWDAMDVVGIDASAYKLTEGKIAVPDAPGFGLKLDDSYFARMVQENGWMVQTKITSR